MESQTEITIFILITFIAMLTPAAIIVAAMNFYKRRLFEKDTAIKQLANEKKIEGLKILVETEEKERAIIAGNLHDGVIPNLCAIQSNMEAQATGLSDFDYLAKFSKSMAALTNAISEVRGITHNLTPPTLARLGFIDALEEQIDFITESGSRNIIFENQTAFVNGFPFSANNQNNMYRICLELLQNLEKYANYNSLQVVLSNTYNCFIIEFIHDGLGINNDEVENLTYNSKGIGLRSIKSRISILQATIDYCYDKDTAGIKIIIPYQTDFIT